MSSEPPLLTDDLRRRLRQLGETPHVEFGRISGVDPEGLTCAAVLAPLTEIDGQICAVFTKRPDTMAEHSGEISFPGGRIEAGDNNLLETALRETHEEIALSPDDVTVYGNLVRMPTVTGYDVTTFVGEFDPRCTLEPNPREIEELFMAPLVELADPSCHRIEARQWREHTFDLHFYDYQDHLIWGATGYMLYELLEFLKGDDATTDRRG